MISFEQYITAIGGFNPKLKFRTSFVKRAYRGYFYDILFMLRFYTPSSYLRKYIIPKISSVFLLTLLLILAGDVETNPGPVTIIKTILPNLSLILLSFQR